MIKDIKSALEYIKTVIETTATASIKAILRNTFKVNIDNQNLDVNVKNFPEKIQVSGDVNVKNKSDYTNSFLEIQREIEKLPELLRKLDKDNTVKVSNLKDIKIPSKIEVSNPQKEVKISNLDALYKAVVSVKEAINQLPKEFPEIHIPETKIPEFPKFPDIKFPKIPEFPKEISVKDFEKLVKLAEQLLKADPKKPLSVRLSNGKEFYEAITEVLTSGGGAFNPFTYRTGGRESALITGKREQVVSMVEKFTNNDVDTPNNTTTYIGQEDVDGNWLIQKITQSGTINSFRYATIKNNSAKTTYAQAWSARTTLSYGKVSEALT